jgi:hypothetical protein
MSKNEANFMTNLSRYTYGPLSQMGSNALSSVFLS